MRGAGGKMKAMDLLKSALAERQAKAQKVVAETGQKWIRRGELEQKRKEEYFESQRLEEEKRQAEEQAHFRKLEEHLTSRRGAVEEEEQEEKIPSHILNDALLGDDDAEPPVATPEVMERLREMAQPITLFGETDMVRYRRLRQCEREIHEGKKNPDLVMLENVHAGQQMSVLHNDMQEEQAQADNDEEEEDADTDNEEAAVNDDKSDSEDEGGAGGAGGDKSDSEDEGDTAAQAKRAAAMQAAAAAARRQREQGGADGAAGAEGAADGAGEGGAAPAANAEQPPAPLPELDVPEVDLALMDKCDFIRMYARKALKAWEKELADKPEDEKKTQICKTEIAQHRQVRRDVRPLQKRLRLYRIEDFLLGKLYTIVQYAEKREYRNASEAYIDLSIGKAAWPVGIGCGGSMLMEDAIGLHDRFNRNAQVKDIAHALNDDVTRKFVQALKRLMGKAARYWPPVDPSQA